LKFLFRIRRSHQWLSGIAGGRALATRLAGKKRRESGSAAHRGILCLVCRERYPGLEVLLRGSVFAPKGTPKEIIDRLNAATVQALADPLVQSRLADLGFEIFPREQQTSATFGAFQKVQIEKWWPLIKEFGIKAE
jgi:hypothetical protein